MHIDSYFSLSNSKLDDADYVVFGVPYDATQTFNPGSRFAPTAVRVSSWNLEEYSMYFHYDLRRARVFDAGNVRCDGSFDDIMGEIASFLKKVESLPVAIGGEHTISYAIVRALREKRDFKYVVFDAHFDLRNEFDSNVYSHACNLRRIIEAGVDAMVIGVRSGSEEEVRFAEGKLHYITPWEMDSWLSEVEKFVGNGNFYVSLDVDVFDPAFAPEVSTPEPFGIKPSDFLEFLSFVSLKGERVVGFDVVEIVPASIPSPTSILAAKMIFEFIAAIEKAKCRL